MLKDLYSNWLTSGQYFSYCMLNILLSGGKKPNNVRSLKHNIDCLITTLITLQNCNLDLTCF